MSIVVNYNKHYMEKNVNLLLKLKRSYHTFIILIFNNT